MTCGALVRTVAAAAVLAAAGLGACQQAATDGRSTTADPVLTASGGAGGGAENSGGNVGKSADVTTFYTHEGAELLYRQAKYAQAQAMCDQAIAAITKAKGDKSPELAAPLIDEATVYMRLAKFDDARMVLERAEKLLDKNKPDQALLLGRLGINKGWRLYTLGETDAATKVFEDSEDLIKKNQKGDSIDLAELINNVGLMYEEKADKDEDDALMNKAFNCLVEGWQMRRKLTGEESFETGESLNNMGMHLVFYPKSPQDFDLGLNTLRKSLEVAKKAYGESHPETAMSHSALALALLLHGDKDEAKREIEIAIPMTEQFLGDMHPDRSFELMTLGRIDEAQGQNDQAEKAYTEALAIDQHVYGKTHPNTVPAMKALEDLYDAMSEPAKALEMKKQIEELSGKAI